MHEEKRKVQVDNGEVVYDTVRSDNKHPVQNIANVVLTLVTQMLADEGVLLAGGGMYLHDISEKIPELAADEQAQVMHFDLYISTDWSDAVAQAVAKYGAADLSVRLEQDSDASDEVVQAALEVLKQREDEE